MAKDLYIIGAGNVGGFIAYQASSMGDYLLKGFLDDDPQKLGVIYYDLPVIANVDSLLKLEQPAAVALAIANPKFKKLIVEKLSQNKNISFPNFIHPQVWQGAKVKIGAGCIIYPGVTINYESEIENFVTINMNTTVGHNCKLMNYSTLSPGVACGGFTELGEGSFLGIGACTLQSTTIGSDVTVGAGAVVIRDVENGATMVGNPARRIK